MKTKFFTCCLVILFISLQRVSAIWIFFCSGSGQAYILHCSGVGDACDVKPAGGCAGGPWGFRFEIAVPAGGTGGGNINWANAEIIALVNGYTKEQVNVEIPQEILDAAWNGTLPKYYVRYEQLNTELRKAMAGKPFIPIERFRIHPNPVKGKTIRFSFYSEIDQPGNLSVFDIDQQQNFTASLNCKAGMNEMAVHVPDNFSGSCLFHFELGQAEVNEMILIE